MGQLNPKVARMAQRVITQLVDDLDGKELKDGQGETVTFGLDGVTYEIDLATKNASSLRNALQPYVDVARKSGGNRSGATRRRSGPSTTRDAEQTKAIREWAKANGHKVSDRGRISAEVVDAYEAAH